MLACKLCGFTGGFGLRRQLMGGFQRGGGGSPYAPPPPPEKSPKIGFLSILVRFPLKSQSYQVSIPCWVINQRNAIQMVFRWQANDGLLIVVFGSSLPSSTKKTLSKLDPPPPQRIDHLKVFPVSNSQPPSGAITLN